MALGNVVSRGNLFIPGGAYLSERLASVVRKTQLEIPIRLIDGYIAGLGYDKLSPAVQKVSGPIDDVTKDRGF